MLVTNLAARTLFFLAWDTLGVEISKQLANLERLTVLWIKEVHKFMWKEP